MNIKTCPVWFNVIYEVYRGNAGPLALEAIQAEVILAFEKAARRAHLKRRVALRNAPYRRGRARRDFEFAKLPTQSS